MEKMTETVSDLYQITILFFSHDYVSWKSDFWFVALLSDMVLGYKYLVLYKPILLETFLVLVAYSGKI